MEFTIRQLSPDDVDAIAGTFAPWNKRREQYVRYLAEQQAGERVTLVAVSGGRVIGYTNVLWRSGYARFSEGGIPEINDLNVIGECQNRGVGRALIGEAERVAAGRGKQVIGIGVGLTPDYAAAQHLYPRLGYVPDGQGAHPSQYGDVTYFTKRLGDEASA